MNMFIVLFALMAIAAAAPTTSPEVLARRKLPALRYEEIRDEFGQYAFRYITAEGTIVSERGRLVPNHDGSGFVLVTEGETSFIGDDGKIYITKYSAGFDGTKIESNDLSIARKPIPDQ